MDDESLYGPEFYRLDFSKAVKEELLSNFHVIILNINESHITRKLKTFLSEDGELKLDDIAKIGGCYRFCRVLAFE